jgi:hypothetical protein
MKLLLGILSVSLLSSSTMAQHRPNLDALIDRWAADNQVHVTKQARKEAHALELRSVEVGATGELEGSRQRGLGRSFWIERFPTIRLVVEPTPPRDYIVSINGEDCPPTERGLYKVPIGATNVRVERSGRAPCLWSGTLVDSRTQEVLCNF